MYIALVVYSDEFNNNNNNNNGSFSLEGMMVAF
jgi:hypothetical protein